MKNQNVTLKNATILVTGAAGFIGSNLVLELLRTTEPVYIIGIDNMNDYYDVSIKAVSYTHLIIFSGGSSCLSIIKIIALPTNILYVRFIKN